LGEIVTAAGAPLASRLTLAGFGVSA
jgi:hypothetical protein